MADEISKEMLEDLIYANGIDGETGEPLMPALPVKVVADVAQGKPIEEETFRKELAWRHDVLQGPEAHFGVRAGIDPEDLSESGWGILFAQDDPDMPAIKEALSPLLDLRKRQAGERYYDETHPQKGLKFLYQPTESKNEWLARNGAGPGTVDPAKVPYYLLIVGDPEKIPYRFQHQLDVSHAVGRIHFDTLQDYNNYARSVVAAETGQDGPLRLPRKAAFFGVRNHGDRPTGLSATQLVDPLAKSFAEFYPDWQVGSWLEKEATKEKLATLIGGDDTPAFLFTASHGMGFSNIDHPRMERHQGALICSDWRGSGPVQEKYYFSADDVSSDANLLGMVAFHFACYGAGTPMHDQFAIKKETAGLETLERVQIAPKSFVARLPQRLLTLPKGGALAVIGHVDRAWGYSFLWTGAGRQLTTFESSLTRMFDGSRLGSALEEFGDRYAEISTELSSRLEDIKFHVDVEPSELAGLWTANNDARSYVILGDPAVKLAVAEPEAETMERPTLESITIQSPGSSGTTSSPAVEPKTGELKKPEQTTDEDLATADFAVIDAETLREARDKLVQAVKDFAEKLGTTLEKAVDNASSLEVSTYVSDDMSKVTTDFAQTSSLRAYTRINIDGDTIVCVPERSGDIDETLWRIHLDMVGKAQANRAEMMKAAVSAAAGLIDALKVV